MLIIRGKTKKYFYYGRAFARRPYAMVGRFGLSAHSIFAMQMCLMLLCLIAFSAITPSKASAAARTWDGGGADNNWSTCANWSSDTCPVAADTVTFNGTSTKNSVVDASFGGTITSITIASGYSGTLSLSRSLIISTSYSQATGTFTAGSQVLDMNGSFTLSGGNFTASSTTTTLAGAMTISGSPVFTHNSGTWTFDGTSGATLSCNSVTFNVVSFAHSGNVKTVNSNCSLPLGSNPTIGNASNNADISLSGTLSGTGTLTFGASSNTNDLSITSTGALSGFSGLITNGAFTLTNKTMNAGAYTTFTVVGAFTLSTGASFTAPATTSSYNSNFTVNTGTTFNQNGGDITFGGTGGTLACNNIALTNVSLGTSSTKTVSATCDISLKANPTVNRIDVYGGVHVVSGTFTSTGLVTLQGGAFDGFEALNVEFFNIHTGTYDFSDLAPGSFVANDDFNMLGDAIFYAPPTMELHSHFDVNHTTTNAFHGNGGTVIIKADEGAIMECNDNTEFSKVVFDNTSAVSATDCNLPLGNNPTVGPGLLSTNRGLTGSGKLTALDNLYVNGTTPFTGFSQIEVGATLAISDANQDLSSMQSISMGSLSVGNSTLQFPELDAFTGSGGVSFNGSTVTTPTPLVMSTTEDSSFSCFSSTIPRVDFRHTATLLISSGSCDIDLGDDPSLGSGGDSRLNAQITGSGDITSTGNVLVGTSTFTGFDSLTTADFTAEYANLDLSTLAELNILGDLHISEYSLLILPDGDTNISGNLTRIPTDEPEYADFDPGTGTVNLTGTNQEITGDFEFYNLSKVTTASATLTFQAGSTQTVINRLTLKGNDESQLLSLVSSTPGEQWNISADSNTIRYIAVADSHNTGTVLTGYDSVDNDNNDAWAFLITTDEDNIPLEEENAAPNDGDGNNDGTPDSEQANVASFVNDETGEYATLGVNNACTITSVSMGSEASNTNQDAAYQYPYGMMDFTLDCGTPGFAATIHQYYHNADFSTLVMRKYDDTTDTYRLISGATIENIDEGEGVQYVEATYQVTDGGILDMDDTANGVIVDPSGLASALATDDNTPPATDNDGGAGQDQEDLADTGQDISTTVFASAMLIVLCGSTFIIRKRRNTHYRLEK